MTPFHQIIGLTRIAKVAQGVAHVVIGLTWLLTDSASRTAGIEWVEFITPHMIGWAWLITGVVAATIGLQPRRTCRLSQTGFGLLMFTPTVVGLYFLVGWVGHLIPSVEGGAPTGITTAASYAALAVNAGLMSRVTLICHRVLSRWGGDE